MSINERELIAFLKKNLAIIIDVKRTRTDIYLTVALSILENHEWVEIANDAVSVTDIPFDSQKRFMPKVDL